MRVRYWPLAVGLAVLSLAVLPTPTADAGDTAVLGGGAGIVVAGNYCTLTTIGHDYAGELIGFTAGHCGGPGAPVVAEGANNGPVGTVVAVGDGMDYGVIKFDPAKVTPTANFAGFAINGIGPAPDFKQPACRAGAASGNNCGDIGSLPNQGPQMTLSSAGPFQPGDDGGPVTSDNLLLGIVHSGKIISPRALPPFPVTGVVKFSAILNDLNAKGGPGAGFSPIPS